eukprot:12613343-Alexandrium_andersonii.AAC.1
MTASQSANRHVADSHTCRRMACATQKRPPMYKRAVDAQQHDRRLAERNAGSLDRPADGTPNRCDREPSDTQGGSQPTAREMCNDATKGEADRPRDQADRHRAARSGQRATGASSGQADLRSELQTDTNNKPKKRPRRPNNRQKAAAADRSAQPSNQAVNSTDNLPEADWQAAPRDHLSGAAPTVFGPSQACGYPDQLLTPACAGSVRRPTERHG